MCDEFFVTDVSSTGIPKCICQFIVSHSTSLNSSQRHDFIVSNLFWPSNNISPPALRWIPALQRSVYVLHSSTGIPKRICQFMVKACCVAATNDVPVHMSARRAISPTLSPIQSFLTLLFKKIYSRTHQLGRQKKIAAMHGGCFNLMP